MKTPVALIVEDDEMQSQIIQAVLTRLGITTHVVSTAREFIARIKGLKPDFCLVDLNVETLGVGFTVIQAVRKALGSAPVLIVLSGVHERVAITHALDIGANDYIVKPVDRDVLISKISRYVQTPKILEAKSPLLPVPDGGVYATLNIDFRIQSVDEIGINILSPHLLSKGMAFLMGGAVLEQITGKHKANLMTVVSTSVNADGEYAAYVEFDKTDTELVTSVRRWLSQQK